MTKKIKSDVEYKDGIDHSNEPLIGIDNHKVVIRNMCQACKGSGRVMATPINSVSCETCLGTGIIK